MSERVLPAKRVPWRIADVRSQLRDFVDSCRPETDAWIVIVYEDEYGLMGQIDQETVADCNRDEAARIIDA